MAPDHFSCGCPFCLPRRITLDGITLSRSLVWMLVVMLLVKPGRSASISAASPESPNHLLDNKPQSDVSSQKMMINSNEATSCGSESCNCYPLGKCKPCSRFDMGRQQRECLRTGYKQHAYCPSTKQEHFISCHYTPHPFETRMFWLFEGSAFSLGALAYAIVYLRQRRIEKMVAMRIQQQINA
ncbi:uncharacterized protein LOC135338396 [Halichondria panicea]|uniref:uncharacterized protein LOC135338396 n=1 Tax=Halichondria panicea TaxID=6063 RepID=UPI00312BB4A0